MNRAFLVTAVALSLSSWLGCAASEKEVYEAKTSGYATDFAIVYSEALEAVTKLYPHLIENASAGTIKTQWHPIRIRDDEQQSQGGTHDPTQVNSDGTVNQSQGAFRTTRLGAKNYFIRFDVAVVGGKPWRVKVQGHASVHEIGGGVPTPLTGAETPPWLEGRENALRVAIHRRLRKHAVKLKFKSEDDKPKAIVKGTRESYGNVPDAASKAVTEVHRAALTRDAAALRSKMVDEFSWSAGGAPSADVAIATWQADGAILGELARVLDAGCRTDDSGKLVTCPPAYTEQPSYDGYRAGFKLIDGDWKMAFFLSGR